MNWNSRRSRGLMYQSLLIVLLMCVLAWLLTNGLLDVVDARVFRLVITRVIRPLPDVLTASVRPRRFEFPERAGALRNFLDAIGDEWNISLFHYRR